jgi:membrane-associated protease RseP (regulator of RpoE activity)
MADSSAQTENNQIVTEASRFAGQAEPVRVGAPPVMPPLRIPQLNRWLFLLTLLTTTMAGAAAAGADLADLSIFHPLDALKGLAAGLSFSIPLMAILLAHEMGHFLTSRRYGVDTSLPYFVPIILPWGMVPLAVQIGTFGAFIRMRSVPRSRRAMFDIGAAGPWAGFAVALAAIIAGLHLSPVTPLDTSSGGIELGNSIIFWSVARVVLGVDPDAVNVNLHPMAYAGWIGLFVTTLNLLPVGQLDGGHVIYSLFGPRWHRVISRYVWLGCLLMVIAPRLLHLVYWPGWILWFVLILVLGLGHPATQDAETPLVGQRRLAAWATVLLFVVTFTPVPFSIVAPKAPLPPSEGPTYSVIYHASPSRSF